MSRFSFSCLVTCFAMAAATIIPAGSAMADDTERVSESSTGAEANENSFSPSVSASGRYVVFGSQATNLVPGDTNGSADVFLHDRTTGVTERVSISTSGQQTETSSDSAGVSRDGRYVVFLSQARNLVPGDTNDTTDVFLRDRLKRTTKRLSQRADGTDSEYPSSGAAISANGRYIVFSAYGWLVPEDTNDTDDTYLYDRVANSLERVSLAFDGAQGNGSSGSGGVSEDGRYVTFTSLATNLVPGDTAGSMDVFVRDRILGTTKRVSVSSTGEQGDLWSFIPSISAGGRFIVFYSDAANLVPDDTNGHGDIFLHDQTTATTKRVSVGLAGIEANAPSYNPAISDNGRFVSFSSDASNLVPSDNNGRRDVFVHDQLAGVTERVSLKSRGQEATNYSDYPSISAGGRYVTFHSRAHLTPDDRNGIFVDVFVRDRCRQ